MTHAPPRRGMGGLLALCWCPRSPCSRGLAVMDCQPPVVRKVAPVPTALAMTRRPTSAPHCTLRALLHSLTHRTPPHPAHPKGGCMRWCPLSLQLPGSPPGHPCLTSPHSARAAPLTHPAHATPPSAPHPPAPHPLDSLPAGRSTTCRRTARLALPRAPAAPGSLPAAPFLVLGAFLGAAALLAGLEARRCRGGRPRRRVGLHIEVHRPAPAFCASTAGGFVGGVGTGGRGAGGERGAGACGPAHRAPLIRSGSGEHQRRTWVPCCGRKGQGCRKGLGRER